jgi:hypothetical protein
MEGKNMDIIAIMKYGSHLYGLETANSDKDYKGVFLPSLDEIFLGKIPKSISENTKKSSNAKNGPDDVDCEYYSLHNFIDMCCNGNTIALDMLHAPDSMIIESSILWKYIVEKRHMFYTKRLNSYLGYAKNQVAKYGKKGDRLNSALAVYFHLNSKVNEFHTSMSKIWDHLYFDENVKLVKIEGSRGSEIFYEVCGRKIQRSVTIANALEIVNNIIRKYGERSKRSLDGTDWKAVTHAVRACLQLKELYSEGTITFPLKDRDFLMKIKTGQMDFEAEVAPLLDDLFNQVEELCNKSNYPEKVDRAYWDNFILNTIRRKSEWMENRS